MDTQVSGAGLRAWALGEVQNMHPLPEDKAFEMLADEYNTAFCYDGESNREE